MWQIAVMFTFMVGAQVIPVLMMSSEFVVDWHETTIILFIVFCFFAGRVTRYIYRVWAKSFSE